MPSPRHSLPSPRAAEALRGVGVTLGPSLLLDVGAARATAAGVAALWRSRRGGARRVAAAALALAPWAWLLARPWLLHWGASAAELTRALPGDELVPNPLGESTRAISIQAAPEQVWPWLVQLGYGRGGWYSYDWLEAAAGAGDFSEGRSAQRVVPQWQQLAVGDLVYLSRWTAMQVARCEPPRALVLHSRIDGQVPPWGVSSWAFVLEPAAPGAARLLVRGRSGVDPRRLAGRASAQLMELPHFVMERRMLLGLKQRAERARAQGGGPCA